MTKVQENLMLKWLNKHIDDEDAQLLIKDFDPDNLKHNLDLFDNLIIRQTNINDSWSEFLNRKNYR